MTLSRRAPRSALLLLLLWSGCVTNQVERTLERELPQAIGPADRYDVEIEGLRARTGEARRVTIVGERVRPKEAPVLERIEMELQGIRYDEDAKRLERVESARATARVLPGDLAAFLEAHRSVQDVSVALQGPDAATLRVRPELGGLQLPAGVDVEVTGRLVARDGHVHFDVARVRAAGLNLGGAVARRLSEAINPVVDLSGTPARLQVTRVRVEDGAVHLDATGDLTGFSLEQHTQGPP